MPSIETLWDCVDTCLDRFAATNGTHPLKAVEVAAYTAMMLCAISQFTPSGAAISQPRLPAHWSVVLRALDPIRIKEVEQSTITMSNATLTNRDRYIWTLFARCLIFADRWCWRLDDRDGIVQKLFDVLNARHLVNLTSDRALDFPSFLSPFTGGVDTSLSSRDDTALHIFLKLLVKAVRDASGESVEERRRSVSRFLVRLTPMRKMPFLKAQPAMNADLSLLYNHYSLFITFVIALPSSSSQRLAQLRSLLSFEEADNEARPVIIRAIMTLAIVYRHLDLAITPLISWLASICQILRREYLELEMMKSKRLSAKNGPPIPLPDRNRDAMICGFHGRCFA